MRELISTTMTTTVRALIICALTAFAWADEQDAPNSNAPVVFANSQIKPWGMEINGVAQGLLIDTQYALSLETGLPHVVHLQPYARVIHSVYSGNVDMAMLFDARVDHSRVIRIAEVTQSRVIVVGRADTPAIESLKALEGKRVGHMRGSKYGPQFDEATHFTRIPINTMFQALAMLRRGRIDAMAGVDMTFFWTIQQSDFKAEDFAQLLVVSRPTVGLYISKLSTQQDLIPLYRDAVNRLREKGILTEIFGHSEAWAKMEGWSAPWQPTLAPVN